MIEARPTRLLAHAALMAGVSRRTMYYWVKAGLVEHKRMPIGGVRVFVDRPWPALKRRGRKAAA